jgi:hypothetical protein
LNSNERPVKVFNKGTGLASSGFLNTLDSVFLAKDGEVKDNSVHYFAPSPQIEIKEINEKSFHNETKKWLVQSK